MSDDLVTNSTLNMRRSSSAELMSTVDERSSAVTAFAEALGIDEANAAKVLAAATCIISSKPKAEYLDEAGAALHLKSSRRRLKDLRTRGNGPPYLRLGGCVRYRRDWLDSWAAKNA